MVDQPATCKFVTKVRQLLSEVSSIAIRQSLHVATYLRYIRPKDHLPVVPLIIFGSRY